jgi:membrane-bound lytic murein transglycosylase MltF
MNDEIIAEVHAIKIAIGLKYADNLGALFEELRRGEAELKAAGVLVIDPPLDPAGLPNSALQRTRFAHR